jgi:membrane protein implicated in regulation of membrane protease activity
MHHHGLLIGPLAGAGLLLLLLPPELALPLSLTLTAGSAAASYALERSLRRVPVTTGREGLLGSPVTVLGPVGSGWQVRHQGEIWSAVSQYELQPGEQARVTGVAGLRLSVIPDDVLGDQARTAHGIRRRIAAERQVIARALARLERRSAHLEQAAGQCETLARSALPHNEPLARQYLLRKHALLAAHARLAAQAATLRTDLAALDQAPAANGGIETTS